MVLCTSSNLQQVCVCLLKDLDILYEQQARALQDPISFVEKLQNNVTSNIFKMFLQFYIMLLMRVMHWAQLFVAQLS